MDVFTGLLVRGWRPADDGPSDSLAAPGKSGSWFTILETRQHVNTVQPCENRVLAKGIPVRIQGFTWIAAG
jgi:hypothetical protein